MLSSRGENLSDVFVVGSSGVFVVGFVVVGRRNICPKCPST